MMKNNDSAFPVFDSTKAGKDYACIDGGMTLRDYAAIKVLPAIYKDFWESCYAGRHGPEEHWREGIAKEAYLLADAMLKERNHD